MRRGSLDRDSSDGLHLQRLVDRLAADETDTERLEYLRFHRRRYELLVGWVRDAVDQASNYTTSPVRLIDIGPSYQTLLFRNLLHGVHVDTLGIEPPRWSARVGERHLDVDLNDLGRARWPDTGGGYDVVVMAEVVEHLHCATHEVLRFMAACLSTGGHLILQTPNAVSLRHRVAMGMGQNPFEMIRASRTNPGHFREYTVKELSSVLHGVGFEVLEVKVSNYFGTLDDARARAYAALCAILPSQFRDGITLRARWSGWG